MIKTYLCRHGETAWTVSGQHTGVTDIPLTENGKKQAALLGERLKKTHFSAVFSSPRFRALDTCKIAGFQDIVVDSDLQEWNYGKFEGLTTAEIKKIDPHWSLFTDGAPGGESLEEVVGRADRMLYKLCVNRGAIAVFSHGHFSRVLAARWLKLDAKLARCFFLSPASMSILGFEHGEPVIDLWNSV
jgi:probable phosphoglycerate mutase